jgi:hypothetical protein
MDVYFWITVFEVLCFIVFGFMFGRAYFDDKITGVLFWGILLLILNINKI